MLDFWVYPVGFALFFVAAFTKGIIGFGVNLISIPIMSLLVGPRTAIALTSLPGLMNNLILIAQRRDVDSPALIRRFMPVLLSGVVGIAFGSFLLVSLDPAFTSIIMGLVTTVFVLTDRVRKDWRVPPEREKALALPIGFTSGLLGGVSGISGPILVAYLISLKLSKNHFVYALSVMFVMFGLSLTISLWLLGAYTLEILLFSLFCLIPLFLGTVLGTKVQDKISQLFFNRLVLVMLFIVGLDLLRRGFHLMGA